MVKLSTTRFEFTDKQVNRVGQYETKGQVLVNAGKTIDLATKKVNVNTIGEINLSPKIEKLNRKEHLFHYIDETYVGGITMHEDEEKSKNENHQETNLVSRLLSRVMQKIQQL